MNAENINSAKNLWKTIKEQFASSQTANQARFFNDFLYQPLKPEAIASFITKIKISLNKMLDVGIKLPLDILVYLVLFKFPSSLQFLRQQIMHSNKEVTVNLVLNHLTQLDNKSKSKFANTPVRETALTTNNSKPPSNKPQQCSQGYHNPSATDHPEDRCWHKHEHLAPDWWKEAQAKWRAQRKPKGNKIAHYHALLTTWISKVKADHQIVLDSGASCHMFNSSHYFSSLQECNGEHIGTGKEGANLPIKGKGKVVLTWRNSHIQLSDCLYVPDLVINLISPGVLVSKKHCLVSASGNSFKVLHKGTIAFEGFIRDNLFALNHP